MILAFVSFLCCLPRGERLLWSATMHTLQLVNSGAGSFRYGFFLTSDLVSLVEFRCEVTWRDVLCVGFKCSLSSFNIYFLAQILKQILRKKRRKKPGGFEIIASEFSFQMSGDDRRVSWPVSWCRWSYTGGCQLGYLALDMATSTCADAPAVPTRTCVYASAASPRSLYLADEFWLGGV